MPPTIIRKSGCFAQNNVTCGRITQLRTVSSNAPHVAIRGRYIIWAMAEFPIGQVRVMFPALQDGFIFFDNAAGAQSPMPVLNAVAHHLLYRNVQRGGRYRQSQEVDEAIARARESVALLVNARHPDEISFGMNATSFMPNEIS